MSSYNLRYKMICRDELQLRMLASVRNVFSVMADISLEECHEGTDEVQENWVTALLGFEGAYIGQVALHCPEPLARRTTAGLLGKTVGVEIKDVHDAMGEVVNILGCDMKLYLDSGSRQVQLSTPSVFVGGKAFRDVFLAGDETVACTLAVGDERLMIGVQVSRKM